MNIVLKRWLGPSNWVLLLVLISNGCALFPKCVKHELVAGECCESSYNKVLHTTKTVCMPCHEQRCTEWEKRK